ncbi:MAG: hypothetical protein E7256_05820 [Lachnospiraceae bacterium]|nr:hypothetical protein [Lachnospiraceae bacterium]
MKGKKELVLSELTRQERQELEQIVTGKPQAAHVVFGMMAMDLLTDEERRGAIRYQTLAAKIVESMIPDGMRRESLDEFITLSALFNTWIQRSMTYKNTGNIPETFKSIRGLEMNMAAVKYALLNQLCEVGYGSVSEKQREMERLYEKMKKEGKLTNENVMQYVMATLRYGGFERKEKLRGTEKTDVSTITYEEYANFNAYNRTERKSVWDAEQNS